MQIDFWNGFTGPDGRVMLELVREFNRTNPDVRVTMQRIPWATFYNKVMVSALYGRGPHVFVMQSGVMPRAYRAGIVMDVTHLFDDKLRAEFSARMIDRVEFDGKLYGLPLDVWPQGMFVNAKLLREAGFVNADGSVAVPRTRDEFLRVAKALTDPAKGTFGFAYGMWTNNFMTLAPQFGGEYLDSAGNPTLDHPGNVAALQFLVDLHREHNVTPNPEGGIGGWVGFRQERVAMEFDGIYMLGDLKRLEGLQYLGAPIPQIGPKPGTMCDSHLLCIRKGVTPEQQRAAERFMLFLSEHSLAWADAGQVPARRSVRESDAFRALPVQAAFATQLDDAVYSPKTPSITELTLYVNLAVEKAIRGRMTAEEALHEANESYKRYLERDAAERAGAAGVAGGAP